ncbi:PepSY-like domain-containing protein [Flavobacterium sp. Fl-318]|uniref:PepSY-like domain-containing protein n=1 Tax=Flavobacterium cupriresistens TaxID=2893885 RepID=A0ABU4RJY1_9FLAO|nr:MULTISPECIES: PepSY-like domain-containing protein [unclassified Flavobacterium]MDX6191800.1 PepSY-like domain-containing protein [Flavobacterium sp. Fl-318]UFH41743.1 PepSY-like domain-containing protein [Flavobacterium sp. F-323]
MKNVLLLLIFLGSGYLRAQEGIAMKEVVTPPEVVRFAFEKQYPNKTAVWAMEYVGDDNDEIRYEAKFNLTTKTKALSVYDNLGNLKATETQIPLSQLPPKAQAYLKQNYPAKAIREIAIVVDDKNKTTYEVGIEKKTKFYDVVFDKNGGFDVIIQKD